MSRLFRGFGQSLKLGFTNATIAMVSFVVLMHFVSQCSLEIVYPCSYFQKQQLLDQCSNVTCTLPEHCKDEATAKANHYKIVPRQGCYACCAHCSKLLQENEPCPVHLLGVYHTDGFCDEDLHCDPTVLKCLKTIKNA